MDDQTEPGEPRPDTSTGSGDDPAGTGVSEPGHVVSAGTSPPERPLSPGEALTRLFLDNADNGRNAANDELIAALRRRAREIQALADLPDAGTAREDEC